MVLEPSERVVIEPLPNDLVLLVTVFPPLSRVVEVDPEPKGRVVVLEPSERVVIEPLPNDLVLLVTAFPFLDGSAASEMPEPTIKTVTRIAAIFPILLIFLKVFSAAL